MKECRQVQKIMESIYDEANMGTCKKQRAATYTAGQRDVQSHVVDQPEMANGLVVPPTYVK